jgi:hypothetical protein
MIHLFICNAVVFKTVLFPEKKKIDKRLFNYKISFCKFHSLAIYELTLICVLISYYGENECNSSSLISP